MDPVSVIRKLIKLWIQTKITRWKWDDDLRFTSCSPSSEKWTPVCLPFREHCMSYPCNVQLCFPIIDKKKHKFDSSRFLWYLSRGIRNSTFFTLITPTLLVFTFKDSIIEHTIFFSVKHEFFNSINCLYDKSGWEKAHIHSFAWERPQFTAPPYVSVAGWGGGGERWQDGDCILEKGERKEKRETKVTKR